MATHAVAPPIKQLTAGTNRTKGEFRLDPAKKTASIDTQHRFTKFGYQE